MVFVHNIRYEIIIEIFPQYRGNNDNCELNIVKELWKKYADEYFKQTRWYIEAVSYDAKILYSPGYEMKDKCAVVFHCNYMDTFSRESTIEKFENGIEYIVTNIENDLSIYQVTITKSDIGRSLIKREDYIE